MLNARETKGLLKGRPRADEEVGPVTWGAGMRKN
jgi:hypothetical protein